MNANSIITGTQPLQNVLYVPLPRLEFQIAVQSGLISIHRKINAQKPVVEKLILTLMQPAQVTQFNVYVILSSFIV